MPDGLPNNLYTGGAVVFNSAPYTQFYLQSQARKRAKDEALTKYFADFTKSVNPAGMRTNDIQEGWMQKRNDWEKFYMDNADKIKNVKLDNGKAYGEFMGRYQDLLNDTQLSKNEVDAIKQVSPIISDPEKRQRLTDSFLGNLHNSGYSIYDKRHVPLDITRLDFNAKQVDAASLKKYQDYLTADLKMSEGTPTISIDPRTKSKISTTKSSFTADDINLIASKAENLYKSDTGFQGMIDELANPQDYERLNRVFKDTYGHDLNIQHHEELATAWALSGIQKETTKTALQAYSEYNPYVMEALREKYFDYSQTQQQGKLNNTVDALVDQQIAAAKEIQQKNAKGFYGEAPYLPVDPATLQALNVTNLVLSDDGQHVIPVTNLVTGTDPKTGQQMVTPTQGTPMTVEQYKAAIGKRNVGQKYFQGQEPTKTTTKKSGYTNLTETNKGTIGVKDGKWYDIKTGKPIE